MNKKSYPKLKRSQIEATLDRLGETRERIALALGCNPSTLRRWLRDEKVPQETWAMLHSPRFLETLKDEQVMAANRNRLKMKEALGIEINEDRRPPTPDEEVLELASTESLVEELERRGWDVSLKKMKS